MHFWKEKYFYISPLVGELSSNFKLLVTCGEVWGTHVMPDIISHFLGPTLIILPSVSLLRWLHYHQQQRISYLLLFVNTETIYWNISILLRLCLPTILHVPWSPSEKGHVSEWSARGLWNVAQILPLMMASTPTALTCLRTNKVNVIWSTLDVVLIPERPPVCRLSKFGFYVWCIDLDIYLYIYPVNWIAKLFQIGILLFNGRFFLGGGLSKYSGVFLPHWTFVLMPLFWHFVCSKSQHIFWGKSAFGWDQENPNCQLYLICTPRTILFIWFPVLLIRSIVEV